MTVTVIYKKTDSSEITDEMLVAVAARALSDNCTIPALRSAMEAVRPKRKIDCIEVADNARANKIEILIYGYFIKFTQNKNRPHNEIDLDINDIRDTANAMLAIADQLGV